MPRFIVDVQTVNTQSFQITADSEEEARERYADAGMVVHSESTSPEVVAVSPEAGSE
ncbi:hypothetical protein SEA_MACGULLY_83 [Rhodococcus phage MacGully]|nr:hypothetical protein SEA_MACGULLY_83 [Rhodococcus phage MacGully]